MSTDTKQKVYLAAPFGDKRSNERLKAVIAAETLQDAGFEVYCPWLHVIPHAWDYPNDEWGLMVFTNDISAIDAADFVVVLSYGRESTAGTNWEAGYAFGIGKKVIIVEMTDNIMSLMVANGRYATLRGLDELKTYDWNLMKPCRSTTEQK